jgi:hypothetical protein
LGLIILYNQEYKPGGGAVFYLDTLSSLNLCEEKREREREDKVGVGSVRYNI